MRACIAGLPDGTYRFEDYLETYIGGIFEPLPLPLALTVAGDRMIADFAGASPQVPFPVNSTAAVTAASVFIAVKSVFDPAAPLNQGLVPSDRGQCPAWVHRQRAAARARRLPRRDPQARHRDAWSAPCRKSSPISWRAISAGPPSTI